MSSSQPTIPPLEGTIPGGAADGVPVGAAQEVSSAAPGADPLLGQELSGRYRIVQKLGEGAMGAVYVGEHTRMGRRDAIKVLRGALAGDAEAIRRFTRGARNISAVHHPNVCTIYDFSDTAEGVTFLAMELITGESLRELLEREGALPLERAVAIARQVADALQAAHDAGIVHRDLKPANIMLMRGRDGSDVVKVVDFDIAKAYDEAEGPEVTRVGFVVGTPEYMSPEQLIGERLDGRSDLYSLGLVLFRMLTGTLPFRAQTPQELMLQRLTVAPLSLAEAAPGRTFPETLQDAIRRALSLKAGERQPSAAAFGREISAAVATVPPVAAVAPTLPPTIVAPATAGTVPGRDTAPAGPVVRRRRPAVLVGAGVAVLLLLGGVAWFARPQTGRAQARRHATPAAATAPAASAGAPAPSATTTATPPTVPTTPVASARPTPTPASPAPATSAARPPVTPPAPAGTSLVNEGPPRLAGRPLGAPAAPANAAPAALPPAEAGAGPLSPERRERIADERVVVWRLFDRLGPPYPPAAALLAIRDSARQIWLMDGAGPRNRALAAFIVGNTLIAVGDRPAAIVPWLERAVRFDPNGPGYQKLLDYYRSKAP